MFHQGYIEPQNGTAYWNRDGHLTVWASSQAPWGGRNLMSKLIQMPLTDVTWMPVEIGGGFGGKLGMYLEPLAALLSKKTGKPVKMTMTREEVFLATGPTSGTYVRVKLGAKKDGTIIAGEAWMAFEAGAWPGSPVGGGMNGIFAPYVIPNFVIDGYDVVVNKPKTAAYRAPGTPAGCFAGESCLNELAAQLGMDPLDLRIKNASKVANDRQRRSHGSHEEQPALQERALRRQQGSRHLHGLLGQRRLRDQLQRLGQRRRHRAARARQRRHRRHSCLAGSADG
jgi:xanthine dehydrogenase molybdenum-binding subunit